MQPKVSVVIPVYNQERYVEECLAGVLSQDLGEIEVFCIDDGSTDSSLDILESFERRDDRVKVVSQANQGVSAARNLGIAQALGDFLIFLDPDDYYPADDILRKLYSAAVENNALISAGSFSIYDEGKDEVITDFSGLLSGYTFSEEGFVRYQDYQFDYGFMRFMFKAEFLRKGNHYFPPYVRFQDPPFLVNSLIDAKGFYAIPDVVYRYRLGHQLIEWSRERQLALLAGLADILKASAAHDLSRLHALALRRLEEEYGGVFYWAIRDITVFKALVYVNSLINVDMLPEEYRSCEEKGSLWERLYLIKPLSQQVDNAAKWIQDISDLQGAVLAERGDKENTRKELDDLKANPLVRLALKLRRS